MATKNNEAPDVTGLENFQKKIEAKESILKRIEEINAEEASLFPVLFKKREALKEQRDIYERFKQSLIPRYSKNYDEDVLDHNDRKKLAEYKDILIDLQESLSAAEADMNTLGEKKNALQKSLQDFNAEITESDVFKYQEKVAEARKTVEDITEIIKNKKAVIDNERCAPSLIDDLGIRKEDILADIALGKNLQKELENITKDIETEKKRLAKREQTILEAEKALPGLNRKLSIATENLKGLENQKSEILVLYLMGVAEQVGKEYGEAALILIDKYNRLISLDALMILQGGKAIGNGGFHDFSIPAFHLNSINSFVSPRMPHELSTARMACTRENKDGAVTREKKRISESGIEL